MKKFSDVLNRSAVVGTIKGHPQLYLWLPHCSRASKWSPRVTEGHLVGQLDLIFRREPQGQFFKGILGTAQLARRT
jgi:hypothetical protein